MTLVPMIANCPEDVTFRFPNSLPLNWNDTTDRLGRASCLPKGNVG
jgi:hypothetical protein